MKKKLTFCKAITLLVIIHGITMVTMSYVLAWYGRETVENVSMTMITEIVAPLCVYLASNTIANIFEKNKLKFSTPLEFIKGYIKEDRA